ncbi:ParA family protein [Kineococcus sp. SYSU DK001]|uniref:ParA family protein n=1 Tax=Kineococcus sp. SYSU DK001 TaxID=3383122 RepID=UPI003D7DB3A4
MSAKIISLFNHKGGVSKTTTTFNLGWMLARLGKRVILVDADPQCNLTAAVRGLDFRWPEEDVAESETDIDSTTFSQVQEEAAEFWSDYADRTLHGALRPAFESAPKPLEAVECFPIEGREGLFLLPGSLRVGEFEVSLSIAQELSGSIMALQNVPGAAYYLLQATAEKYAADYVLVDMSPSLGALNQNLVTISDLLVVPTSPDYFSLLALQSLAGVLPRWARWARQASESEVLSTAFYPYPEPRLKLAGAVIQRYRLYRSPSEEEPYGTPTSPFREWIRKIESALEDNFVPALKREGLTFDAADYAAAGIPSSTVLAQIQEFNSLLPKAQEHGVPVYELTQDQLGQVGVVYEGSQRQIASLDRIFSTFANRVNDLAQEARL